LRKRLLSLMLSVIFILMFGVATNASLIPLDGKVNKDSKTIEKCKKEYDGKYHELSRSILLQNLGLTKEEVEKARESGKSIVDLAKAKGMTLDQIKAAMLDAKTKSVDQAVKDGKISKEEGANKIARMKKKISKWDGSVMPKHHHKHQHEKAE
jgi:hypothetical protein